MSSYVRVPIATNSSCNYPNCPHHAWNRHLRVDVRINGVILRDMRRHDLAYITDSLLTEHGKGVVIELLPRPHRTSLGHYDARHTDGQIAWMQSGMPEGVRIVATKLLPRVRESGGAS